MSLGTAIGAIDATLDIPPDIEEYIRKAKDHYDIITQKNNISWLDAKFFKRTLKQQLKADCEIIPANDSALWKMEAEGGSKAQRIGAIIARKHQEYGEHAADKVVVFTQYSDTARYIYYQLRKRGFSMWTSQPRK